MLNFRAIINRSLSKGTGIIPHTWRWQAVFRIQIFRSCKFLGLPDPELFVQIWILPSTSKIIKKNLDFYSFMTSRLDRHWRKWHDPVRFNEPDPDPFKKHDGSGTLTQRTQFCCIFLLLFDTLKFKVLFFFKYEFFHKKSNFSPFATFVQDLWDTLFYTAWNSEGGLTASLVSWIRNADKIRRNLKGCNGWYPRWGNATPLAASLPEPGSVTISRGFCPTPPLPPPCWLAVN